MTARSLAGDPLKPFVLYTGARIGLFLACYGLIWLIFGRWIGWNSISALYTALIAMAVSSVIALVMLRSLRADLSAQIAGRAGRAKQAFDARTRAEDDPDA
jgi:hypothetical protein